MARAKEPQSYGNPGDWLTGSAVSPAQIEENVQPADACEIGGDAPTRNVNMHAGGAKRGSYFRDRDYKR